MSSKIINIEPQKQIERAKSLTMPEGALNGIISPYLKIIQQKAKRFQENKPISSSLCAAAAIFAGDHETAKNNAISAYPTQVTGQMVLNFVEGGSAMSVLCKSLGIPLSVCALGVDFETAKSLNLSSLQSETFIFSQMQASMQNIQYSYGSKDISMQSALCSDAFEYAWKCGKQQVDKLNEISNPDVFIFGEMGIGNTTNATALGLALLKKNMPELVGSGTGISSKQLLHKKEVIQKSLLRVQNETDSFELLRHLGGFEITAMCSAICRAAELEKIILLDGIICTSAAFAAISKFPNIRNFLISGHISSEPLHKILLEKMELKSLLDLNFRLGEGSGAALAWSLLLQAENLVCNMATFESANISQKEGGL